MVKTITLNEPLIACQNYLGEGCLWNSEKQLLHWVDIYRSTIHTLDPKTKNYSVDDYSAVDPIISSMALRKDGKGTAHPLPQNPPRPRPPPHPPSQPFTSPADSKSKATKQTSIPLHEAGQGLQAADIPGKYMEDEESKTDRFNDGAADARGRYWVGSMGSNAKNMVAQLYRYEPDTGLKVVYEDIGCSNGIGFSPDNKLMYYIDSEKHKIDVIDFNLESGSLSNRRTLIDSSAFSSGTWDGLCTDSEGAIWAARWGNNRVVRVLPGGEVDVEIVLPGARNVTCCIFGGEDMSDLFITTASCDNDAPELTKDYPQGGDLFHVKIDGIKGVERFKFGM